MVRLVAVFVLLVTAVSARAEEVAWPRDLNARLTAQIAACKQGDAAICLEAAAALGRSGNAGRNGETPASLRARATQLLDEQCAAGTAASCFEHGRILAKHGDVKIGLSKVTRGCELGSGAACTYVAARTKNPRRVSELIERACTLDDAHACETIAANIEKKDPTRAVELHRKACAGHDVNGCIASGKQRRAAGDKAGAFSDFESACEIELEAHGTAADLGVCDDAGVLATDAVVARELFKNGCDAGHGRSCVHLGERIARGEGGERDWGAGLALVADGCKRAQDSTCKALAELKKHPPDWSCTTIEGCIANCKEGLWPACRRVAELDPIPEGNVHWLELACTGDDSTGCRLLGDAATSFKEALPSYRKACKLRDATACTYVRLDRALHGSAADVAALRSACSRDASVCALYGLALARKDRKRATIVLREACDKRVGVACRFLARTFDDTSGSGSPDAMIDLALGGRPELSYGGTCGCDGAQTPERTRKQVDDANHRFDEAQRLLRLGCAAGDALSCEDEEGPDRADAPPANRVVGPVWK